MKKSELVEITNLMQIYGDNFIKSLAGTMLAASDKNLEKLLKAFPEEIDDYKVMSSKRRTRPVNGSKVSFP